MKEIRNSETLQRWLLESGHLGRLWDRPRFYFDGAEFDRELAGVREQYPRFRAEEAEARAALRLLGKQEAASRLVVLGGRRSWTRRERMLLLIAIALLVLAVLLLGAPRVRAQDLARADLSAVTAGKSHGHSEAYRSLWLKPEPAVQSGQPGGVIIQVANQGTVLATRPAGLLQFNCSTNLSCSFSGTVFTMTATGGSGSGCIPPGSTANALLFDAGSSTCNDVSKLTWNSGTSTMSLLAGGIFDPTAGTVKVPGSTGQLLYNNGGNLGAEDPIVSGPDATGSAPTKNPVETGALDNSTSCSSGPCVRSFTVANAAPAGSEYGLIVRNIPSGTQPVSGTFWQATQPVSLASLPALAAGSNTIGAVTQASGPWSTTDSADGSTGSAVPAKARYSGGNGSGNLTGYLNCDNTAAYDASTNGATQLVALASGKRIYVCGFQISTSQTTAVNVGLVYGTGSNCGTGQTKLTPAYPLQAAASSGPIGMVVMTPGFTGLATAASNALCINTNAAASVQALVWYTQF
jgi:hypothetical protein